MIATLKRLAREPLVHFVLIGAAIYAVYGFSTEEEADDLDRVITVSPGEIQSLKDRWLKQWHRSPTDDEIAGLIRNHVRTQALYREALAMGLDDGDQVIQRRLAQKVEYLVESMLAPPEPSNEELQAWFEQNGSRFEQPDRYSISHVYFNPDKRGDTTLDDAEVALRQLHNGAELEDVELLGDRFLLDSDYQNMTESELRRLFGSGFVDHVVTLEPGIWHGPVLSGYGTHLVIVRNVIRVPPPGLDDVRPMAKAAWMNEKGEELTEVFIENLTSRYEVVVEGPTPATDSSDQ